MQTTSDDPFWDYLKRKGRLKTLNISEDEIAVKMLRVSGDCVCEKCNKKYYDHPLIADTVNFEGRPYLYWICDGTIAKL